MFSSLCRLTSDCRCSQLVELINRDYADFVRRARSRSLLLCATLSRRGLTPRSSLSTQLVDVSGAVGRMRGPLGALEARVRAAHDAAVGALSALDAGLARRAQLAAQRAALQADADAGAAVAKAERLLSELDTAPPGAAPPLLERAAGELARASSLTASSSSGAPPTPQAKSLAARAAAARARLAARLRGAAAAALGTTPPDDVEAAGRVAAFGAAHGGGRAGCESAASQLLRDLLLKPLLRSAVAAAIAPPAGQSPPQAQAHAPNSLARALDAASAAVASRPSLLLRPAPPALRCGAVGPTAAVLELGDVLQSLLPDAFSAGRPDAFVSNHAAASAFAAATVAEAVACGADGGGVASLRSTLHSSILSKFNVPAYCALRVTEIAAPVEAALGGKGALEAPGGAAAASASRAVAPHAHRFATAAAAAVAAACHRAVCPDVFVPAAADRLIQLFLQAPSRFAGWAARGAAARARADAAAEAAAGGGGGGGSGGGGDAPGAAAAKPPSPEKRLPQPPQPPASSTSAASSAASSAAASASSLPRSLGGGGGGGGPHGSAACEWALSAAAGELAALASDASVLADLLLPDGALGAHALTALQSAGIRPAAHGKGGGESSGAPRGEAAADNAAGDEGAPPAAAGESQAEAQPPPRAGEEAWSAVEAALRDVSDSVRSASSALRSRASASVVDKCVEALRQLRGITAVYRLTNKPPPTRASHFLPSVLAPLRTFLDPPSRAAGLPQAVRDALCSDVADSVTRRYEDMARDLLATVRKTESSLRRLKDRRGGGGSTTGLGGQAPGGGGGGGGGAGGEAQAPAAASPSPPGAPMSDTDKICRQMALDVAEFGRQLAKFGVDASTLPSFAALTAAVAEGGGA